MKNYFALMVLFGCSLIIGLSACEKETDVLQSNGIIELRASGNNAIYPPSSHPFGKSYEEWAQQFWEWVYSLDCGEISERQLFNVAENVKSYIFITEDFSSEITIGRQDALLISVASYLFDYPCPAEFGFEPAPGQSLEDFLQENVTGYMDYFENIQVSIDGASVGNINQYRLLTDLFYFTANPDLVCWDPCVTGESQPGAIDGYFIMLKKLPAGSHTLTMHGAIPFYDYTWDITLQIEVE